LKRWAKSVAGMGLLSNQRKYDYHSICFIQIWCFLPSSQGMMLDFEFENAADNAKRFIIMVMTA